MLYLESSISNVKRTYDFTNGYKNLKGLIDNKSAGTERIHCCIMKKTAETIVSLRSSININRKKTFYRGENIHMLQDYIKKGKSNPDHYKPISLIVGYCTIMDSDRQHGYIHVGKL